LVTAIALEENCLRSWSVISDLHVPCLVVAYSYFVSGVLIPINS